MIYAIYFKSRKNFRDPSTWSKELMPSDYTEQEVAHVARLVGCEGYALWENFGKPNNRIISCKWLV